MPQYAMPRASRRVIWRGRRSTKIPPGGIRGGAKCNAVVRPSFQFNKGGTNKAELRTVQGDLLFRCHRAIRANDIRLFPQGLRKRTWAEEAVPASGG